MSKIDDLQKLLTELGLTVERYTNADSGEIQITFEDHYLDSPVFQFDNTGDTLLNTYTVQGSDEECHSCGAYTYRCDCND